MRRLSALLLCLTSACAFADPSAQPTSLIQPSQNPFYVGIGGGASWVYHTQINTINSLLVQGNGTGTLGTLVLDVGKYISQYAAIEIGFRNYFDYTDTASTSSAGTDTYGSQTSSGYLFDAKFVGNIPFTHSFSGLMDFGVAYTVMDRSLTGTNSGFLNITRSTTEDTNDAGFLAGAGFKYAFSEHNSARVTFDYITGQAAAKTVLAEYIYTF